MRSNSFWLIGLFTLAAMLAVTGGCGKRGEQGAEEVLVLCGGTMRGVIEAAMARYRTVSEDRVMATYGDSAEMCSQLENTGRGDIYVGHDPFMPWAEKRGLITAWATVAYLDNVLAVPKGNPKNIREMRDLARPGLRVGTGDQRYSTSGVMVKEMLARVDYGAAVQSNIVHESKGHSERITSIALGALDAGIVWAPVAKQSSDKVEVVPLPADAVDAVTSATYGLSDLRNVGFTVGLTKPGGKNAAARRFYDYVTKNCGDLFAEHGFRMERHQERK
ncbi:MAG: substrate-binding domain-containing protein [Kiritimatiellae bacterium]|nr:substrate-binding domain-containing protein [Kiritimatiellia bacterium]